MKKIAAVERKARWEDLKGKYPHMSFTGQMEPAHQVMDKFHGMRIDGELRFVAAHEIPTREQELQNVKTEEMIKKDATGHLRAHDESRVPDADVRTDLRPQGFQKPHHRVFKSHRYDFFKYLFKFYII